MNVMLLAAGEGTRLRPYTNQLPKPAIPFLTVPLAAHSLSFLQEVGIEKLVVNTYHLPEKIHSLFHRINHGAKELHFSDEVGEILGSGGGLSRARKYFKDGGDFIMMNADEVILPVDSEVLTKAIAQHRSSGALATLMVMDHHEVGTKFGGVWTDSNGNIKGFGKTKIEDCDKAWHFIGVQILSERIFDYLPKDGVSNILYDGVMAGLNKGEKAAVYPFECTWFETGNPADLIEASEHCIKVMMNDDSPAKRALQKTFNQFASSRIVTQKFNDACLHFSSEAIINNESKFSGFVCAGPGTEIGKNCSLENVIIGDGVHVADGTIASNTLFL
ncbi:sugar phosphate nucleotidyltransferase [Bdellovibrio sp. SKB1291214]|uniref:sugar phosphate nucleotidyltransferase n=1 Tax=Bdellovibrio sp. SKB1291214 TaxID=1732569 RepID=UPI000B514E01|nr:sugar phosphate nucleotidyltransferase [Bdellovibrio sp. SKB1291214]UYL10678.1 sugar phosphate nucleotidyltransferase [Bdellovibrio sp. SKB1291214]